LDKEIFYCVRNQLCEVVRVTLDLLILLSVSKLDLHDVFLYKLFELLADLEVEMELKGFLLLREQVVNNNFVHDKWCEEVVGLV
jgi:hypothetical protein